MVVGVYNRVERKEGLCVIFKIFRGGMFIYIDNCYE